MNAQAAAKQASGPQTRPLPDAKPQSLGLSPAPLARHFEKRGWFTLEKRPCSSQNFWANLALTMPAKHPI